MQFKYEFQCIDFNIPMRFESASVFLSPRYVSRDRRYPSVNLEINRNALDLMRKAVEKVGTDEDKIVFRENGFYEQQLNKGKQSSAPPDLPEKYYTDLLSLEVNDGWEIVNVYYADKCIYPKILFQRKVYHG
jgi:hypothetical protein